MRRDLYRGIVFVLGLCASACGDDPAIVVDAGPALLAAQTASRRLPPWGKSWPGLPHAPKFVATSAVEVTLKVAACAGAAPTTVEGDELSGPELKDLVCFPVMAELARRLAGQQ